MYETAAEFVFKISSNGGPCLGEGWGPLEPNHAWSIAEESHLRIPVRPGAGDLMLQLMVTPFLWHPFFTRQRLIVEVDGVTLAEEVIEGEATIGCHLAADRFGKSGELRIRLHHPDALCPAEARLSADTRRLGVALHEVLVVRVPPEQPTTRRLLPPLPIAVYDHTQAAKEIVRGFTALYPDELMSHFESLGHNCEFGMVQRQLGADPLGLLRFSGITPHALLRGLDFGFEQAENPALMRIYSNQEFGDELMMRNDLWGLETHTFHYRGQISEEEVKQEQVRKLSYYRRKLVEDLESGEKLFVYQYPDRLTEALMLPLLTTLRSYGRNALLFVRKDRTRPPGTVEKLRRDLYMGSIDKLAPVWEADRVSLTAWISLCANAYRLWREDGGGAG